MPEVTWSQDEFSRGELSPMIYGRVTIDASQKGVKKGLNTITYPQGGIGKRFGTIYRGEVTGVTDWRDIFFESFPYLNECVYLLVFVPGQLEIYLEDFLVATIAAPTLISEVIRTMDWTILDRYFRIAAHRIQPKDLTRTSLAANPINAGAGIVANQFTLTNPITGNIISAARFTTTGTLPVTTPQIITERTYFIRTDATGTLIKVYNTAAEASADTNAFTLTNVGTGVNNVLVLNSWSLVDVVFQNRPQYDFTGGYDTYTFNLGATIVGSTTTLTSSTAMFNPLYVGGTFSDGTGMASITAIGAGPYPVTQVTVLITSTFPSATGMLGRLCQITEPAWSNTIVSGAQTFPGRGWPAKCSSFQSRAVFANTELLPNGIWLSVINDYNNFDMTNIPPDDDDCISYYPSSDTVNVIRFLVPYRSFTVHTNTGIYSTPLSFETALTPSNFSLQLQESNPATAIQPQGVDNQIIIVSGNDVHTMLWDGINNAYASNIISVYSEHLFSSPHDEIPFVNLNRAGSRYVFFINDDGSMIIYQTLIAENVSGFTPCTTGRVDPDRPELKGYFRWGTSSPDGRAWFVIERQIANELVPPFTYSTKYFIEEISFDVFTDCSYVYSGPPTLSISGLPRFNGRTVVMQGDGYGFEDSVTNSTVEFVAHGQPFDVTNAFIGLPVDTEIQLMPNNIPGAGGYKGSSLVFPQHIRNATFFFNNTIGGFVNGQPISIKTLEQFNPLTPPEPLTGLFKKTLMSGWNEFYRQPITITHSEPFDIRLLGVYYKIEE
jgi:hypothetical protein